jgi:hypothetical protein
MGVELRRQALIESSFPQTVSSDHPILRTRGIWCSILDTSPCANTHTLGIWAFRMLQSLVVCEFASLFHEDVSVGIFLFVLNEKEATRFRTPVASEMLRPCYRNGWVASVTLSGKLRRVITIGCLAMFHP